MPKPLVLVTSASGKTGAAVTAELRRQGWPVRAVVHRDDARAAALRKLGAEVVVADLYDAPSLTAAATGAERVYFCAPFSPHLIQAAAALAVACRSQPVEQIVMLGQWLGGPAHPALLTRQTWLAEQLLQSIPNVAFTCVDPGFFADNYLRMIDFAADLGVLPNFYGRSRNAPPSNEDIARTACAILTDDPRVHAGQRYRPTGPELLSAADMAQILTRVLGRTVRPMPMPMWLFRRAARLQGVDAFEIAMFAHYVVDHREGAFEAGAPNSVVQDLTGRPPESFQMIAERYAASLARRPGPSPALATFLNFMRTPFHPPHNVAALERGLLAPVPKSLRTAMDDPDWRASHFTRGGGFAAVAAAE